MHFNLRCCTCLFLGSPDIRIAKQHFIHVLFCRRYSQDKQIWSVKKTAALAEICALCTFAVWSILLKMFACPDFQARSSYQMINGMRFTYFILAFYLSFLFYLAFFQKKTESFVQQLPVDVVRSAMFVFHRRLTVLRIMKAERERWSHGN